VLRGGFQGTRQNRWNHRSPTRLFWGLPMICVAPLAWLRIKGSSTRPRMATNDNRADDITVRHLLADDITTQLMWRQNNTSSKCIVTASNMSSVASQIIYADVRTVPHEVCYTELPRTAPIAGWQWNFGTRDCAVIGGHPSSLPGRSASVSRVRILSFLAAVDGQRLEDAIYFKNLPWHFVCLADKSFMVKKCVKSLPIIWIAKFLTNLFFWHFG
jgi:hypothetical protein